MSEEELKKMIEETSISDDPFIVVASLIIIKKIINLADNDETTIDNLLLDTIFEGEKFEIDTQEKIYEIVFNVCKRINIKLEKANYEERFVGLPFKYAIKKIKINNDRFTYQEGDIQFKENKMNNIITFEKAKQIATEEAKKYEKIIVEIEENDEYWFFETGFEDGHNEYDDGIGSIYISKKDGSIKGIDLWDVEFTEKFKKNSKEIYNYFENKLGNVEYVSNKIIDDKVQEFARQQGYQKAKYLNEWNGYKCYEPIFDESKPSFTGLPLIILVDSNNNIRMSTSDEAFQQMRESK